MDAPVGSDAPARPGAAVIVVGAARTDVARFEVAEIQRTQEYPLCQSENHAGRDDAWRFQRARRDYKSQGLLETESTCVYPGMWSLSVIWGSVI